MQRHRPDRQVDERPLAASERTLLPEVFAKAIDLGAVRIVARWHTPIARMCNAVVVRDHRIFWPGAPAEATTPAQKALLAHELVHVWQYRALGRSGLELLLSRAYRYDLREGRSFLSYGFEQQAAIVEDFVRVTMGLGLKWARIGAPSDAYERIIATAPDLRERTPSG
jgi:hypothetical protein